MGERALHSHGTRLSLSFYRSIAATALGLLGGFDIVGTLLAGTIADRLGRKNLLALIDMVRATAFTFLPVIDTAW
jgi:MFS family permease